MLQASHCVHVVGAESGSDEHGIGELRNPTRDVVATERGQSLALLRPLNTRFYWKKKSKADLASEVEHIRAHSRQASFLDNHDSGAKARGARTNNDGEFLFGLALTL